MLRVHRREHKGIASASRPLPLAPLLVPQLLQQALRLELRARWHLAHPRHRTALRMLRLGRATRLRKREKQSCVSSICALPLLIRPADPRHVGHNQGEGEVKRLGSRLR